MVRACSAALALAAVVAAASAQRWDVIAQDLLTTELGIGFRSETEGFIAGDANGAGPEIFKSTNGGLNWTAAQANFGADALLLGLDVGDKTVIVSSIFGELYSNDDGATFHQSLGGGLSQSVRHIGTDGDGGEKFGCAGTYRGHQGVALTTDGGRLFNPVFADVLHTYARYAAYPSDNVWYIAAGEFPSDNNSNTFRRSAYQNSQGRFDRHWKPNMEPAVGDNGYKAQLARTTDGGKTWESLFAVNGSFYFNGIDCTSETHCCAVGEAADPPFLGAGIWCTEDGRNFNRTFYAPYSSNSGFSLIDVRFATPTFGWAVGGELNALAPKAWFLKTEDGGRTWDAESHVIFGYYALGLSVVSERVAYAAVDNLLTQTSGVAKYTP